jgi:hypothetical protein
MPYKQTSDMSVEKQQLLVRAQNHPTRLQLTANQRSVCRNCAYSAIAGCLVSHSLRHVRFALLVVLLGLQLRG